MPEVRHHTLASAGTPGPVCSARSPRAARSVETTHPLPAPSTHGLHSRPQKAQGQRPPSLAWLRPQRPVEGPHSTALLAMVLGEPDTQAPVHPSRSGRNTSLCPPCRDGGHICQGSRLAEQAAGAGPAGQQPARPQALGREAAGPAECSWESSTTPAGVSALPAHHPVHLPSTGSDRRSPLCLCVCGGVSHVCWGAQAGAQGHLTFLAEPLGQWELCAQSPRELTWVCAGDKGPLGHGLPPVLAQEARSV